MSTARLTVRSVVPEAEGVLGLVLVDPTGAALAPWEPGAHLEVTLPSGAVRHYSLCGDPAERSTYRLGVLREPGGRGGSEEIHTSVGEGTVLGVRGPFNRFPLVPAERYLFIAGGIGITPSFRWSVRFRRGRGPCCTAAGAWRPWRTARSSPRSPGSRSPLRTRRGCPTWTPSSAGCRMETAVYCCGPEGLLRAVEERWSGPLHTERFGAAPVRDSGAA